MNVAVGCVEREFRFRSCNGDAAAFVEWLRSQSVKGNLGNDDEGAFVEFDVPAKWTAEQTSQFARRFIERISDAAKTRLSRLRGEYLEHGTNPVSNDLVGEIAAIRRLIEEGQQQAELAKQWYSTQEAAKFTGFQPYTIRQACNLGRIKSEWRRKDERTGRWLVHRDGVDHLRNFGLPPKDSMA